MTQQHTPLRSSLTAIAAVLALSSTAAFAQSADQTPDSSAPTIAAPPAPVISAAPATAEPTTSDTAAPMTATPVEAPTPAAPAVSPAAPMATQSTPVVHMPDADASARASAPAKRTTVTKTEAPATHVTTTTRSTVSTTHSATPLLAKSAPAPVATPTPAPAPVLPATPPAAATSATTRTTTQSSNDNALEIAGAIGLGVIVLGTGAFLLARRRRDDEDEELLLATEPTERTIVTPVHTVDDVAATEAVTAVPATPILAREEIEEQGDEQMTLANGFDLSRFGPHVRAAYRGPTPDNPSHSLHRRLAHARFFDLRERQAIERGEMVAPAPQPIAARTAKAPAAPAKNDEQIVVRPGLSRARRFFGTAFQR